MFDQTETLKNMIKLIHEEEEILEMAKTTVADKKKNLKKLHKDFLKITAEELNKQ